MIAVSTYSFTIAFSTKFKMISILLIVVGFAGGGMYGVFTDREFATIISVPSCLLYGVICVTAGEWIWRYFYESENCLFYTHFFSKNRIKMKRELWQLYTSWTGGKLYEFAYI